MLSPLSKEPLIDRGQTDERCRRQTNDADKSGFGEPYGGHPIVCNHIDAPAPAYRRIVVSISAVLRM
jgi:hypothetical protein